MFSFLTRRMKIKSKQRLHKSETSDIIEVKERGISEGVNGFNDTFCCLGFGKTSGSEAIEKEKKPKRKALKLITCIYTEDEKEPDDLEMEDLQSESYVSKLKPKITKNFVVEGMDEEHFGPIENNSKSSDSERNEEKETPKWIRISHSTTKKKSTLFSNFDRDSYMRNVVFVEIIKFTNEKFCQNFEYASGLYEMQEVDKIDQENERKDYILWNRLEPMGTENMILLVTTLGQWHGCCLAFKHQHPEVFEVWSEKLYNVMPNYLSSNCCLKMMIKNTKKVLDLLETNGYQDLVDKYSKKIGTFGEVLLQKPSENSVIGFHADCWTDNINFKYQVGEFSYISSSNRIDKNDSKQ